MSAPIITQEILKSLIHYEPETGEFVWLHRPLARKVWNTRYSGKRAGFDWRVPSTKMIYRSIRIFDWPFLGHRLAVLYMTGEWPPNDVDHKDQNGLNNRWTNLRLADKRQNGANRGVSRRNKLGFKGVTVDNDGRFRATLGYKGKQVWLGRYNTPEEAHAAYLKAAREHFGEFAL